MDVLELRLQQFFCFRFYIVGNDRCSVIAEYIYKIRKTLIFANTVDQCLAVTTVGYSIYLFYHLLIGKLFPCLLRV